MHSKVQGRGYVPCCRGRPTAIPSPYQSDQGENPFLTPSAALRLTLNRGARPCDLEPRALGPAGLPPLVSSPASKGSCRNVGPGNPTRWEGGFFIYCLIGLSSAPGPVWLALSIAITFSPSAPFPLPIPEACAHLCWGRRRSRSQPAHHACCRLREAAPPGSRWHGTGSESAHWPMQASHWGERREKGSETPTARWVQRAGGPGKSTQPQPFQLCLSTEGSGPWLGKGLSVPVLMAQVSPHATVSQVQPGGAWAAAP